MTSTFYKKSFYIFLPSLCWRTSACVNFAKKDCHLEKKAKKNSCEKETREAFSCPLCSSSSSRIVTRVFFSVYAPATIIISGYYYNSHFPFLQFFLPFFSPSFSIIFFGCVDATTKKGEQMCKVATLLTLTIIFSGNVT